MHDVEEVAWQKYAEITAVSAEKLRIEQGLRRWRPRGFRGTRGLRGMTSRKYRALSQLQAEFEERHGTRWALPQLQAAFEERHAAVR
jgi:hypothetical protein